ncbi:MAG: glycoside hydrolase family 97 N-terminal domain-containing protein, partial [Puniceicoccales bacterium]|nr:glycoside hydrolase family 97 N-terminal domain-containing protein [Puniceicoccales bacterium]
MRPILFFLAALLTATPLFATDKADLPSPDGNLVLSVSLKNKQLGYSLARGENPLLDWAPLGLTINNTDSGAGLESIEQLGSSGELTRTFPVYGIHAEGKVKYIEYRIGGLKEGQTLRFRIFNDGVAFRYEFPQGISGRVNSEATAFGIRDNAVIWTQDGGAALGPCEGAWYPARVADFFVSPDIENADPKELRKFIRTGPVLAVLPGNHFLLVQEAGSFGLGWSGLKYAVNNGAPVRAFYYYDRKGFVFPEKTTATPWRVVLATRSLDALVNSDIVSSLVLRPDPVLFPEGTATDWCKPGRATWTWLATGGARYNDQLEFVDFASELGFEYHLVDDGWEKWKSEENLSPWEMLGKVVERGRQKNVKIWAWKRWEAIRSPDNDWAAMRDFFDKIKTVGVVGLKIDFMDSDSQERL